MSTPFALTSASELETPVIVIDTCIVGGDSDHFSSSFSSPFTPSLASPSPSPLLSASSSLEPHSASISKLLNIPLFAMTSPSMRNLRVCRGNVGLVSMVSHFTPVNSPASPGTGDAYLGAPDFAVGSPCVRWRSWSLNLSEGEGEGEGEDAGVGAGELMMSPVAPPNTPCSPLVLGSRDQRGSGDGEGVDGEGVDGEVFIGCERGSEESGGIFRGTMVCLTRGRTLGDTPQIVVGFEEEGWGHLGADAGAGMRERCIVENWEMKIRL
ncbi:hypothetical protein BOTCAL_0046g00380 [Botryotinia calthae]|uniref:Uncharacterized protein n=1 Tax=Botryotinia calthae TaxID=38488 RepID=A0A4Y8DDY5_9HELO|nr:hypothetical protein BOTCAL_0046g00380 [Botryotinia calthae]